MRLRPFLNFARSLLWCTFLLAGCGSDTVPSPAPRPAEPPVQRSQKPANVLVVLSLNERGGEEGKNRLLAAESWVKQQVAGACIRLHGSFAVVVSSQESVWDRIQLSNISPQQGDAKLAKLAAQHGADLLLRIWNVQQEDRKMPFLPIQFRGRDGVILESLSTDRDDSNKQTVSLGNMEWSENGKGTTPSVFCQGLLQAVERASRIATVIMDTSPAPIEQEAPDVVQEPPPSPAKAAPLPVVVALGAPAPTKGRPMGGLRLADFAEVIWRKSQGSSMVTFLPLDTWARAVQQAKASKKKPAKKGEKQPPVSWQEVTGQWESGTQILALSFYSKPRKVPPKNKRMYFLVATLYGQDKKEIRKVEIPLAYSVELPAKQKGAPRWTSVDRAAQALGKVDIDSWFPGANAPAPR